MANNGRKECTLRFQSKGDLISALKAAEKLKIPIKEIGNDMEYSMVVSADRVGVFQSLGSINFGLEVCSC